ncbi:MAG: four helix bundle protein [bacterium]|nr:four helix bundle protein [bacterium]
MTSYKDLVVWKRSIDLVIEIYKLTDNFPKEEIYGLTSQMRRSSVSISSNIAEGSMRGTKKDFRNFLIIAFGSGAELETQIVISKRLPKTMHLDYTSVEKPLDEIMRMLNKFISQLEKDTTH